MALKLLSLSTFFQVPGSCEFEYKRMAVTMILVGVVTVPATTHTPTSPRPL